MPELAEQMYCSQQICIPPTFPYLLRQFAKAAIRTQPNDLLQWATTYFRCLSLNIPPPVKPRLEYPIPRDYFGITPGWLRALLLQMQGTQTVAFKVLWDRWIGACLQHPTLIQILCLGGFEDNMAVPWLRFIALCAAHLTENLTKTMTTICEILTEEPEGGSAMIPLQIFLDLYQFLARIDASVPQTLRNYYFLDKFLDLLQEKIAKDAGLKPEVEESGEAGSSIVSTEETTKTDGELKKDDGTSVISCPSVASQDPDNFMKLLMKIQEDDLEEEAEAARLQGLKEEMRMKEEIQVEEATDEKKEEEDVDELELELQKKKETTEEKEPSSKFVPEEDTATEKDDSVSRDTRVSSSKEELQKCPDENKDDEEQFLLEDLERLKMVQNELMGGEDDIELEKFKQSLIAEMPMSPSQMAAPDHFTKKPDLISSGSTSETIKSDASSESEPSQKQIPQEPEYEEVYVEAIPGIGPKVPEPMITAVCNYMKEVARVQHNMVMPRNIRHYECPPLEIINY